MNKHTSLQDENVFALALLGFEEILGFKFHPTLKIFRSNICLCGFTRLWQILDNELFDIGVSRRKIISSGDSRKG